MMAELAPPGFDNMVLIFNLPLSTRLKGFVSSSDCLVSRIVLPQ